MKLCLRHWVVTVSGTALLMLPLACRETADPSPGRGGGSTQSSGQGGSAATDGGSMAGALPEHVVQTDSGALVVEEHTTSSYEDYAPSCEEQQCTSDELCVEGPQGTYCVHPCPGQPCPDPALESYCTREGGVICIAG